MNFEKPFERWAFFCAIYSVRQKSKKIMSTIPDSLKKID